MTIKEAIEKVTDIRVVYGIDQYEFNCWCQKRYGMTNNEWHSRIWRRGGMCDDFMSGGYAHYSLEYLEVNEDEDEEPGKDEMIKDFLEAHPEFGGEIRMYFG